jgi:2-hydroxycyclohexanecarboxyl-CoA dehydrogenase
MQLDPLLDLKGRPALITGAGQGIGRSIALHFAAHNAGGVIVNDYHADRAEDVAEEIRRSGFDAVAAPADVSDADQVRAMVAAAQSRFGDIGILVNNAGNAGPSHRPDISATPFWETRGTDWNRWFAVNLYGVMHCCHAVLPSMTARGDGGRIITILSDAGRVGEAGLEAYSAAKAGAAGFLRSLAKSTGRHGITVNMISMGATVTPTSEDALNDQELQRKMLQHYVIRRFGTPEDAAGMATFLASEAAGWITGQTIPVNGGYSFAL